MDHFHHLIPANELYYVYMDITAHSINATRSPTVYRKRWYFKAKFYIPDDLKGEDIIAIRLESQDSPYYSYNWFYNTNRRIHHAPVLPTTTTHDHHQILHIIPMISHFYYSGSGQGRIC
jgi:hypothetical protein